MLAQVLGALAVFPSTMRELIKVLPFGVMTSVSPTTGPAGPECWKPYDLLRKEGGNDLGLTQLPRIHLLHGVEIAALEMQPIGDH